MIVKLLGKSWEVSKIRRLYYIELISLIIFSILRFKTLNPVKVAASSGRSNLSPIGQNNFYLQRYFN